MHVSLELARLIELIFMPKIALNRCMLIALIVMPEMLLELCKNVPPLVGQKVYPFKLTRM